MTRYKTRAVATLALALLTVPALAAGPEGTNGPSLNGTSFNSLAFLTMPAFAAGPESGNGPSLNGANFNSLTSNSLTSNAIFTNGTGLYALNGVRIEGIVLAKSTGPAGKSFLNPNMKSIIDPNDRNLQNSTIDKSVVDPNDGDLPAVQNDPIEMWIELND